MEKSQFLTVALDAAKKAEAIIMKHYGNVSYTQKADLTPVTIADTEAESIIIETIKDAFPDHAFIGEETGDDHGGSPYQWIIDPIDGTKNFSRQVPLFATQIALMKDGEIILGVSNAPAINELMYAEKGKGAFLGDKKVSVSGIEQLSDAYLCFGGIKYFKRNGHGETLFALAEKTFGYRGIGDFWCYHLLAQGKIDIMLEAETKIWDFAAMKIVMEEAGGLVTDMEGNPVTKETTSIIATNKLVHEDVAREFTR